MMAFQLDEFSRKKPSSPLKEAFWTRIFHKEITSVGRPSFSNKQKEAFYLELAVLLRAGLTLKNALVLLAETQKKQRAKTLVEGLVKSLIQGNSFSEALNRHAAFSAYEFHSLQMGEATGSIEKVASQLGAFYQRKHRQRRSILQALSYPAIVLVTAFFAVVFMLQFVVPMFAGIFEQQKIELPWLTRVVMGLSTTLQEYYPFILAGIAILFIGGRSVVNKNWYQRSFGYFLLHVPYVGEFVRKINIARFVQALSLLTGAKVSLLKSLQLSQKMIDFHPLKEALSAVEKEFIQGRQLSEILAEYPLFDQKMIALLKVAEQSNQSQAVFEMLSQQYAEDIHYQSNLLGKLMEPLIIIVLGAVVGLILVAMYLPMFSLSTTIG